MLAAADLERLRHDLLAKGGEIAALLEAMMAGKEPGANDLLDALPGETPEEKARRFLALIESRREALDAGTYGQCLRCGAELSLAELAEMPWVETCRDCASHG